MKKKKTNCPRIDHVDSWVHDVNAYHNPSGLPVFMEDIVQYDKSLPPDLRATLLAAIVANCTPSDAPTIRPWARTGDDSHD
jgi:hypothetical protein